MKVIELPKRDSKKELSEFLEKIAKEEIRPGIFIGLDKEGDTVLSVAPLTWKELAYIKFTFDMHITRDYLGLPMED